MACFSKNNSRKSADVFVIRNITRNTLIAKDPVILTSIIGHMIGLMFKHKITPHVLLFKSERYISLHTFFVSAPIDVIFVNNQGRVVEIKKNLTPFSFYSPRKKSACIIEAAAGTARSSKTKINDILHFPVKRLVPKYMQFML